MKLLRPPNQAELVALEPEWADDISGHFHHSELSARVCLSGGGGTLKYIQQHGLIFEGSHLGVYQM